MIYLGDFRKDQFRLAASESLNRLADQVANETETPQTLAHSRSLVDTNSIIIGKFSQYYVHLGATDQVRALQNSSDRFARQLPDMSIRPNVSGMKTSDAGILSLFSLFRELSEVF